ncbi:MAG: hypothetical protein ABIQ81_05580 [Novosphingobium sp.]
MSLSAKYGKKRIAAGFALLGSVGLAIGGLSVDRSAQAAAPAPASSPAPGSPAPGSPAAPAAPLLQTNPFHSGESGFVVTEIRYALGPDGKEACPAGMSGGMRSLMEAYAKSPAGQRLPDEADRAYQGRMQRALNNTPDGKNICMNPQLGAEDPTWRMVSGRNIKVEGIDLDGVDPRTGKRQQADTCTHEEFQGTAGERGVDNQLFRMIGCTTGFQASGMGNGWQTEMYTGSWGIVMSVRGVDNTQNDPDVQVGIYANADPLQLSADRRALPFATYAVDQDAHYRAETHGRIVNGVLTIDPIDVRFHNFVNSMNEDRVLRAARLRLTFTADGGMEGYLAGYTPVEDMYDVQFGARKSRDAKGQLAPERLRIGTSVGRAGALGYTCNGAYRALLQAADGHRDPATGRCTSISTQYRIRLAPAFVVKVPTKSLNAPLAVR